MHPTIRPRDRHVVSLQHQPGSFILDARPGVHFLGCFPPEDQRPFRRFGPPAPPVSPAEVAAATTAPSPPFPAF